MKKNKIIILALTVLFFISVVSIRMNISNASEQEHIRKNMINNAYSELTIISLRLDGLILDMESGKTDYTANRQSLTVLSHDFTRLHTTLKWYATCFPPGGSRNVYTGIFDFNFIAQTLTDGRGEANDMPYNGLTVDGVISKDEIRYLTILKDDIDIILASMISDENPLQEDQNLTTSQIDAILNTFFSKWSMHNENSPYFLLRSE